MNLKVICHNRREDSDHGLITEGINSANVEMPSETGSDWVSPATWRAHGSNQLDINQGDLTCILEVIP